MEAIVDRLSKLGIVPVVVLDDAKDAAPLAGALCDGGLPCAEVTCRTPAAEEAVRIMTREHPEMLVGAGTVLTAEQADKAVNAGARFIVSPGLNPKVVTHCLENGIPVIPGISGPSEIEQALELGLRAVKFFPAETAGGIAAIRAMAAPYTEVRFLPTGGIHQGNLREYLALPQVIACGGSWMVKRELIRAGEFRKITELTREAVFSMLGFDLSHVGVNCPDEEEAERTAQRFASVFGFAKKTGRSSVFAGTQVEAMIASGRGRRGHIAIGTDDIARAAAYLESRGIAFDRDSANYKDGAMTVIYLKEEIGGFAVHLLQKGESV